MSKWFSFSDWIALEDLFYAGTTGISHKPFELRHWGAVLSPYDWSSRREAHAALKAAEEQLKSIEDAREGLLSQLAAAEQRYKENITVADELRPNDVTLEKRQIMTAVDSIKRAYEGGEQRYREIKATIPDLKKSLEDDVTKRSNIGAAQCRAFRAFIDAMQERYDLIAAFKRWELECPDRDTYLQVFAMLLKRLKLQGFIGDEVLDYLVLDDDKRGEWEPVLVMGGFRNARLVRELPPSPLPPHAEPELRAAFLREWWDELDDSQLDKILGLNDA